MRGALEYLWNPRAPRAISVRGIARLYPVERIFCVGRNYHAHAREMGRPVEKAKGAPFYFTKSAAHLATNCATLAYPPETRDYQYEAELVVAIGRECFRASPSDAAASIFGYACGLDMTRRDLQLAARDSGHPWDLGKDIEAGAVVSDLTPAVEDAMLVRGRISLSVNGDIRQLSDIDQLIWSVPELLSDLSRFYRLGPGDLVFTGTPEGVGPVKVGDRIHAEVEGAGEVRVEVAEATC